MNGIPVGEGVTERPYVIESGTVETIQTTPTIDNSRLDDWWVSHLDNDQTTTLRIDFYARIELATGNSVRVPLDALTYERTIETDIFGAEGSGENETTGTPTPGTTPSEPDDETPTPTATAGGDTATPTPTETPTDDGLL